MIKAVVQSIPIYSMSVFKLLVGLCKAIEAMIRSFGGVMVIQRRFIRLIRVLSVLLNLLGVWVLGISKSSKMPCWLNRCGLFITKTLYFIEYLVLSFFLTVAF